MSNFLLGEDAWSKYPAGALIGTQRQNVLRAISDVDHGGDTRVQEARERFHTIDPHTAVAAVVAGSEARPAFLTHEAAPKILQATFQSLPVVVDDISHARSPLTAIEAMRAGSVGRCGAVRRN